MDEDFIKEGDPVTWNERGVELFGQTDNVGIVLSVYIETAHILWDSGQETWASVSTLKKRER